MTKPGNAAVKPSSSAAKKKALRIEDLQKKVAAMSGQIDGLTKMVDAMAGQIHDLTKKVEAKP